MILERLVKVNTNSFNLDIIFVRSLDISYEAKLKIWYVLMNRMEEIGLPTEPYEWYLDLRRYGTAKHAGFGLGLERMVLFATGIDNIRDVIPFPRYPGKADL